MDNRNFSNLLSPLQIGGTTIKNRFCMGPMGVGQLYGPDGVIKDESIQFFVERAKGGFGLIIQGAQQADNVVDPEVGGSPLGFKHNEGLYRRQVRQLVDRTSVFGTKMFAQISAGMGRNYPIFKAASPVDIYKMPGVLSKYLTVDEIHQKVDAVVRLAKLEQECGYAGVEIHALHWGYLLDQFAMSITNHRDDEYGGCLENRLRMTREIITGIRQECGEKFPVIMRLGLKSYIKGLNKSSFDGSEEAGRTLEEGVRICQLLEEYGFDAVDMDMGIYDSFYYACPPSYIPQGYAIDLYAEAKKVMKTPLLAGSRMQDPYLAEKAIADGKIDAVVLSRPTMADPDLPRKIQMGRPEKIRPCIACCQCFLRALDGDDFVTCAVNPVVYREYDGKPRKTLSPKKILVVGGGVGGMEAARLAKECGHDVELFEKSDKLGGLLLAAGAQAMKKEIYQLNDWYKRELEELGVPVHLNTELSPAEAAKLSPDAIILTIGSHPAEMGFIPGVKKPHVYDCVTALTKDVEMGRKVVVIGGGHVGCEVATEFALNRDKEVTIIELADDILKGTPTPVNMCLKDMIEHYGIGLYTGSSVQEILDGAVRVKLSDGSTVTLECDNVVLAAGFKANDSHARDYYGIGAAVYEIGNGAPTANVLQATREAYEIIMHL